MIKTFDFFLVILLFIVLIFKFNTTDSFLYKPLNYTVTLSKNTTFYIFSSIENIFNSYFELKNIKKKYNSLLLENSLLKTQLSLLNSMNIETTYLKGILNFKKDFLAYKLIPLKHIENKYTEKKNLIITKNTTTEKITVDMGVINERGVVGIVSEVSGDIITILPINNEKSSIPVWVGDDKVFGFISGSSEESYLLLKLKYIEDGNKIKLGDKIITNSYSDMFPEGLIIGSVIDITNKKNSLFVKVDVLLPKNLDNSVYFYVIKK